MSYKIKFTSDQEPTDNLYVNKRAKRSKVMRLWDKSGFSEVMPAVEGKANSDESSTVLLHVMCKGRWMGHDAQPRLQREIERKPQKK